MQLVSCSAATKLPTQPEHDLPHVITCTRLEDDGREDVQPGGRVFAERLIGERDPRRAGISVLEHRERLRCPTVTAGGARIDLACEVPGVLDYRASGSRCSGQDRHRGPPRPEPSSEPEIASTSMPASASRALVSTLRS